MLGKGQTEVLVVGAGPVGLFTALSLARRGVGVRVVDEEWRTAAHSYALALHPGSLALLDEVGLAGQIIRQGRRIDTVAFYDGLRRRAELRLSELPAKFPFLIVMPQAALEDALERRLKEAKIDVQWNHHLAQLHRRDDRMVATIERREKASVGYAVAMTEWVTEKTLSITAALVVGADGHRSTVRRLLEIEYARVGPPELFAVFEFESDLDLGSEVRVVLHEGTTNVLWPLPRGRCRCSFQLPGAEESPEERRKSRLTVQIGTANYPQLSRADLEKLIRERTPWLQGRIGEVFWSLAVRFERRLAERFGQDHVWLAGDSAHLTGPVGVQSMNVGFCEGHDLARRYSAILHGGGAIDSLEEYNRRQTRQWRQLLGLDRPAVPTDGAEPWVRQQAGAILPCIPASGQDLEKLARQIGLEIPPQERYADGGAG